MREPEFLLIAAKNNSITTMLKKSVRLDMTVWRRYLPGIVLEV